MHIVYFDLWIDRKTLHMYVEVVAPNRRKALDQAWNIIKERLGPVSKASALLWYNRCWETGMMVGNFEFRCPRDGEAVHHFDTWNDIRTSEMFNCKPSVEVISNIEAPDCAAEQLDYYEALRLNNIKGEVMWKDPRPNPFVVYAITEWEHNPNFNT